MAIESQKIKDLLTSSFPEATIHLVDTMRDQDHYSLHIISNDFVGKSRVEQHKMVLKALEGPLKQDLHALSIKTSIP